MGNLQIEKINNITVDSGFLRNHGFFQDVNLISTCNKTGSYRIFNAIDGSYPPDGKPTNEGGSDYFCQTYVAEDNKWIRIEVRNVRNSNVWEIMCINGIWGKWELLPNNKQIQSKLDLKVDKVDGMGLSKNDFNDAYKTKVENMQNHFKGVFTNVSDINAQINCVKGDYCVLKGTPDYVYFYNGTAWVNSNASLGGDMLSTVYSPTGAFDLADRRNHHHEQPISTITNLQTELNKKLNITDKTKVVDNFESDSPVDALSANCGGFLRDKFLALAMGTEPIDYGHYFGETGGYMKTGSGLIIQFGQVSTTSSTATQEFVFPIPFTTKVYGIWATCVGASSAGSGVDGVYASIKSLTAGSVTHDYKNTSTTELLHYVFAVGY